MKERVIKIPEKCTECKFVDCHDATDDGTNCWIEFYCDLNDRGEQVYGMNDYKPHWCKAIDVIVREKE